MPLSRRALLTLIATGAASIHLPWVRRHHWGPVDVDRHHALQAQGIFLHVYHGDQDVTDRCRFADDRGRGYADLFKVNAEGRKYREHDTCEGCTPRPAMERVVGIEFRPGPVRGELTEEQVARIFGLPVHLVRRRPHG